MGNAISVHVGLNRVDPDHYGGWDGALRACENDARDMAALAEQLGYAPTLLLSPDGTVRKVTNAIRRAARTLASGDALLVTYAGHGAQVPDRNGDEAKKEAGEIGEAGDAYDETWVLYDRQLVDDELWALWGEFAAGVRIFVVSDSCHSGTVARPAPWDTDNVDPWPSRRMPLDVQDRVYAAHRDTYDRVQRRTRHRDPVSIKASVALLSGCQDNQTSGDGTENGRFTAQLLEVWAAAGGGTFTGPRELLHRTIVAGMPPYQTPNLYRVGRSDRRAATAAALRP